MVRKWIHVILQTFHRPPIYGYRPPPYWGKEKTHKYIQKPDKLCGKQVWVQLIPPHSILSGGIKIETFSCLIFDINVLSQRTNGPKIKTLSCMWIIATICTEVGAGGVGIATRNK